MKFKKARGSLLGIGIAAIILAAALFFLVPVIFEETFNYSGIDALGDGGIELISFNFSNVLYTTLIVLFVVVFAVMVIYAITAAQKKHGSHVFLAILSLIIILLTYVAVSTYFLGNVKFNGVRGKLLDSMLKTDGEMLPKILSSLALALAIIANVVLVVHAFIAMVSMVVTKEVKDFEEKVQAEKEQEVQEKVAEMVACQPAPVAPVAVEEKKLSPEEEIQKLIDQSTYEERKEREMKLFKEAVDSGYFSEYEEIEFPQPLEGFEEEPVCEASIVEEKSAMVRKSSVHVGFTHN